jgi:Protein kinase domain
VGGFRLERLIGVGTTGAVYEATQASLGRTVALRLIGTEHFASPADLDRLNDQQRVMAALHHPNLVPCYATGEWEGGRFVATRFIRGATLAALLEQGVAPPSESLEPLADALRAAHAAGLVHGRVSAENIIVESNATTHLADLGLGRPGSPEEDMSALVEVTAATRAAAAPTTRGVRARWLSLGAAGLGALAIVAVVSALSGGGDESDPTAVPAPPPNTTPIGSPLASAGDPVGCSDPPSPNTPACTLSQTRVVGAESTIKRAGVIRDWVVRGASGTLELQVIREQGRDSYLAGFSQPTVVGSPEAHSFTADIGVRAGDRIGVRLEPGASIGMARGATGSVVERWDGGLTAERRPNTGAIQDAELMLRADVQVGARPQGPEQIVGAEAADAPAGRTVTDTPMQLPVDGGVRVTVVELPSGIAIDVTGARRLARVTVADANPAGELLELTDNCGPAVPGGFCFRWHNPGTGPPLEHQYAVRNDGRVRQIG